MEIKLIFKRKIDWTGSYSGGVEAVRDEFDVEPISSGGESDGRNGVAAQPAVAQHGRIHRVAIA